MSLLKRQRRGMTLAEVLLSIVIASMVLVAVLAIYNQFQRSASAIIARIERPQLPSEILQLIAEDVDRLADSSHEVRVTVLPGSDNGFPVFRLVLEKGYSDRAADDLPLEEIVWQSQVDVGTDRIVLYRKHTGLILEDKLLDPKRDSVEASYPYIPLVGGLTAFRIRVPQGENWLDRWESEMLPTGIEVMIAQAQAEKSPLGVWEVAEKDQFIRTIAIDRTRIIKFSVEGVSAELDPLDPEAPSGQLGQGDGATQGLQKGQPGQSEKPSSSKRSTTSPPRSRRGTPDKAGASRRDR